MREFNYRELYIGVTRPSPDVQMKVPRSKCLHDPVKAFALNMQRVATFAAMPAELTYNVRRDQLLSDCATVNTSGKLNPDLRQFLDSKPTEAFTAEFAKLTNEYFAQDFGKLRDTTEGIGVGYIESVLEAGFPPMLKCMDAIFEAVVLQSWTAFECLAGDLWVAGVDKESGEVLSRLVYSSRSLAKPDDNVRPETVFRTGINPKTNYGSFLRAIRSVSFQTLPDILKYYGIAFGEPFTNLFDSTDEGYIAVLAAFRNAITHSAARADKSFLRNIAPFRKFSHIGEKDELKLDGKLVLRLGNVATTLGTLLVQQMDDLLAPVPVKP